MIKTEFETKLKSMTLYQKRKILHLNVFECVHSDIENVGQAILGIDLKYIMKYCGWI